SATRAAIDADSLPAAEVELHLVSPPRGAAQNHEGLRRFPDPQHVAPGATRFGLEQERLVEGQVFGCRGKREIKPFHAWADSPLRLARGSDQSNLHLQFALCILQFA